MTNLQWLGVGSGLNLSLGNTSFFLRSDGPRVLLIDCGFTVPAAVQAAGVLPLVTDVIITHLHADHIGGLETFAFAHYHLHGHRGAKRPVLHVPSDDMAHDLWEHSLSAGMRYGGNDDNPSFLATLDEYFDVRTGVNVAVHGLPAATLRPTKHVPEMENYCVQFDNGVYYSGDSSDLPPVDAKLIFQDVHFNHAFPDEVHAAYETLRDKLPADARARTWLVHLGNGWDRVAAKEDGFAGLVQTGQVFEV